MPLKPKPLHIECRQCGWTTIFAPKSDALLELPPETCAKCESEDLNRTSANIAKSVVAAMRSLFGKN